MSSLTETAYYARRTINWSIIAFFGYIFLRIFWSVFLSVYLTIFPMKAAPPNHAFGRLPPIAFPPPSASPSGQIVFHLETIQGSVPQASQSANVYFMPKLGSNLLALSKAQTFAKRLGLATTPIPDEKNKNMYRFDDISMQLRHLWYDIISNNFILKYNFESDAGIFLERNQPTNQAAQAEAKTTLQTYDLFPSDYAGGQITSTFYQARDNNLVVVESQSQADAVRVDFYRPNIAGTPVISSIPGQAPISITFSGSKNSKKRILEFAYTYWPIDYDTWATYDIKTSSQAWQELQSGSGYIVHYPKTQVVTVRNVYLAYYDSVDPQTYLQPVFVFVGDDGFLAYVPAISAEWVE
jgi:hypothetical protein